MLHGGGELGEHLSTLRLLLTMGRFSVAMSAQLGPMETSASAVGGILRPNIRASKATPCMPTPSRFAATMPLTCEPWPNPS